MSGTNLRDGRTVNGARCCLALAIAVCACGSDAQPSVLRFDAGASGDAHDAASPSSLVDHDRWQPAQAASDGFAAHRPAQVDCPAAAYGLEDGALEVETGYCNYADLEQPALLELAAGDVVHGVLLHGDLVVPEPSTAHVALSVGGHVLWERTVAQPAESSVYEFTARIPEGMAAGTPVRLHLHNHGFNTWTLLTVERR